MSAERYTKLNKMLIGLSKLFVIKLIHDTFNWHLHLASYY